LFSHPHLEQYDDEPYGSSSLTLASPIFPISILEMPLQSLLEIILFHKRERVYMPCFEEQKRLIPELML
jgi:hypothetical protein